MSTVIHLAIADGCGHGVCCGVEVCLSNLWLSARAAGPGLGHLPLQEVAKDAVGFSEVAVVRRSEVLGWIVFRRRSTGNLRRRIFTSAGKSFSIGPEIRAEPRKP